LRIDSRLRRQASGPSSPIRPALALTPVVFADERLMRQREPAPPGSWA
jgi:hypothetical protein